MLKIARMLSVRALTTIDPYCAVEYVSPAIRLLLRLRIEFISESAIEAPEVDCVLIILLGMWLTFHYKEYALSGNLHLTTVTI